jgi:8-amino-7-oxononanoate synthase
MIEKLETPDKTYTDTLEALQRSGNLRNLPQAGHRDKWMVRNGTDMLNLSSNDYLGLASDLSLRDEFMKGLSERDFLLSASSSRLLTGNFPVHDELEKMLACLFGRDGALIFSSGYHLTEAQDTAQANGLPINVGPCMKVCGAWDEMQVATRSVVSTAEKVM